MKIPANQAKKQVHIGDYLKKAIKKRGIGLKELENSWGIKASTLYNIYNTPDLRMKELLYFSEILKEDLLLLYTNPMAEPLVKVSELEAVQAQLAESQMQKEAQEKENEKLRIENELLKQVVFSRQAGS